MIFDASSPCDLDALHAQALEVVLRRAGLRTLALTPAVELTRLGRALRALNPTAVVLTGRRVSLDSIGRLVYAVRSIVREVVVFDYRGAVPDTGASTVFRLGDDPVAARDALLARLEQATAQNAPRPVPAVADAPPRPPARSGSARRRTARRHEPAGTGRRPGLPRIPRP